VRNSHQRAKKKEVVVELVCNIPQKRPLVLPMFVYVV
jgi:hypothetical protein